MAAFFFPVHRSEAREAPKDALAKLRSGGVTMFADDEGVTRRVPFYRVEHPADELAALVADSYAKPSGLYFMREDFAECPARSRVPERYFRRFYKSDGSIFYVGALTPEFVTRL